MSNQPPYYPPGPEWENNQQPGYGQYGQGNASVPPTQYQPPYPEQPSYSQESYSQPPPPYSLQAFVPPTYAAPLPYGVPARAPDKSMGFAIAGLVLGIIAIVSSWYPVCGLPIPIIGIVMSPNYWDRYVCFGTTLCLIPYYGYCRACTSYHCISDWLHYHFNCYIRSCIPSLFLTLL